MPKALRSLPEGWRQFCEETAVVQFDHRLLAYTTVAGSAALAVPGAWLGLPGPKHSSREAATQSST